MLITRGLKLAFILLIMQALSACNQLPHQPTQYTPAHDRGHGGCCVQSSGGSYYGHSAGMHYGSPISMDTYVSYETEDYRLAPGDQLEISYYHSADFAGEYHFLPGDQLRIEFPYHNFMDRTLTVRPDGKITVPELGDVTARNKTPMELARHVSSKLRGVLKDPSATVSLIRHGEALKHFNEAIRTSSDGQFKVSKINPDGRVTLPMISSTRVAGLTVEEAQALIAPKYKGVLRDIDVTISVKEATGNKFYIMGEVENPGYYSIDGPVLVTQAISMAGGFTSSANAQDVLLISRDEHRRAAGRLVDVQSILRSGNIAHDSIVRRSDVIYVSASKISSAALVGSFLRRLIPFDMSVNYSMSDSVDFVSP